MILYTCFIFSVVYVITFFCFIAYCRENNNNGEATISWKRRKSARFLMRSVSIFIANGRRISATDRPLPSTAAVVDGIDDYHEPLKMDATTADRSRNNSAKIDELAHSTAKIAGIRNRKSTKTNLVDTLKKQTHFTKNEIQKLCNLYRKLVHSDGSSSYISSTSYKVTSQNFSSMSEKGMDRTIFRELLHNAFNIVTEDILLDRIFCAFDRLSDGIIHLDEWIHGLSIFLRGTLEEKIALCFFVYDLNSDGFIGKEEIFLLLRNSLMKMPQDDDPDENVRDLAEIVLKKLDIDRDNKISYQDFRRAILKDNLLLEALGQCLPTEEAANNFFAALKSET